MGERSEPAVHAHMMIAFALLEHAEETGQTLALLGELPRRAQHLKATARPTPADVTARIELHVLEIAFACDAVHHDGAVDVLAQVQAHRVAQQRVVMQFDGGVGDVARNA